MKYDIVIIGAGIYGLYTAITPSIKNKRILILEKEEKSFLRASFINQARVHNGYHYPRSNETISDVHKYFDQFNNEFRFAINDKFKNIYAISSNGSHVSDLEFENTFKKANIPLKKIDADKYFKEGTVLSAYETVEYVFDANKIKDYLLSKINSLDNISIKYNSYIIDVKIENEKYIMKLNSNEIIESECVINTTYASINQVNELFSVETLDLKYELCEILIGKPNRNLNNISFTIMDGNYFSLMPFGLEGKHSLTSVHYTPHKTSFTKTPTFDCQSKNKKCCKFLDNCNNCKYKPKSAYKEMINLVNSYLNDNFKFNYEESLFSIKPILLKSEHNDSRPTIIKIHQTNPTFISCLSGKITTIYIMREFIDNLFK